MKTTTIAAVVTVCALFGCGSPETTESTGGSGETCSSTTIESTATTTQGGAAGSGGDGGTGVGGAGGDGGTGGSATTTAPMCEPDPAFSGEAGEYCWKMDPKCCNTTESYLQQYCFEHWPTMPVPYTCSQTPLSGGAATDYRKCVAVTEIDLVCKWGLATIVCCEISQ